MLRRHALRGAVGATLAAAVLIVGGVTIVRDRMTTRAAQTDIRTYATAVAQQAIVTLANGSQAVLGPASTLTVASNAATGTTVTVTGQALFTVAHRDRAPFLVRTNNAVTRVLGTTFLVRRYVTDRVTRVVVVDGRVSLRGTLHGTMHGPRGAMASDADAVLATHMLGVVDDSGDVHVTSHVMTDDYTAWTNGKLVFHQTPVGDIVTELSRAYGVDLRITDSALKAQAFTWTVSVTQLTFADALTALTTALHAHVTRSGKVLTIVPGPLASRESLDSHVFHSEENRYGR